MVTSELVSNPLPKLVERVFFLNYGPGLTAFTFNGDDIADAACAIGLDLTEEGIDPENAIGRHFDLPQTVRETQPNGSEWVIEMRAPGKYVAKLVRESRLLPQARVPLVKLPDATPQIVTSCVLSEEQSLLSKIRYNRLVDLFLGVVAHPLENRPRAPLHEYGEIEIGEVYVGIDRDGCQVVVPVRAKGAHDPASITRAQQDLRCCMEQFPRLQCRGISAQYIGKDSIALFELTLVGGEVRVVDERHYQLAPAQAISENELEHYRRTALVRSPQLF